MTQDYITTKYVLHCMVGLKNDGLEAASSRFEFTADDDKQAKIIAQIYLDYRNQDPNFFYRRERLDRIIIITSENKIT